jgi:hypothetical protein
MMIDPAQLGDRLHRLAKLALDSGEAASVEDAIALFQTYALHIDVGPGLAQSPARQAALLTAINAASRAFLGGVTVAGDLDGPLAVTVAGFMDLATAAQAYGALVVEAPPAGAARLRIGPGPADGGVRTVMSGWSGGCIPGEDLDLIDDPDAFVLTGVAAAAIAIAELFQSVRGSNPAAGRRHVGVSLWDPARSWMLDTHPGPMPSRLPASAWIIGLGNLGQANLWSLGLLPYVAPERVELVLQDFDRIAESNLSTSLLTTAAMIGLPKTRAMSGWAEARGFQTRIVEQRYGSHSKRLADDPPVALCGVDNASARAALEEAGFARIFEAGLGSGLSDFLAMRLHSFPGPRGARAIWGGVAAPLAPTLDQPAYRALADKGADRCGLVQLAGRTVGAPFVGALAGALVISELVRLVNGGPSMALVDLHLRAPGQGMALAQPPDFAFNPGSLAATC